MVIFHKNMRLDYLNNNDMALDKIVTKLLLMVGLISRIKIDQWVWIIIREKISLRSKDVERNQSTQNIFIKGQVSSASII